MKIGLAETLREVVEDEFKVAIEDIMNDEAVKSNADLLLQLCQLVTSQIDIVLQRQYFQYSNNYGYLYNRGNDISEEAEQKLMIFGAQLIYSLRTFIQKEEITFHMASKTQRGNYEVSAFIPQSEILRSLSSISKKAIGVSNALQKDLINKHKYNLAFEMKRKNLWTQVESLATPFINRYNYDANNKIDIGEQKDGSPHWAYQSLKKDMMVYIAFHGKNYTKYYDKQGDGRRDSLMVFNNGWLWEWYNKILYGGSNEEYLNANDSIMNGSLRPIMFSPDYTPGTKQGDFQDMYGRQIQSKYNNAKIISYNNIRHILYDLETSLTQYIKEAQDADKKLVSVLQEHFFPESASLGNEFAENIVDDLLKQLNAKKS